MARAHGTDEARMGTIAGFRSEPAL